MGNTQSLTRTGGALDSFVAELSADLVFEKSLGTARFLKTVKCRHRYGYVVVKVFIKPDPGLSLRNYYKRLKAEKDALTEIANVHNYQSFVETEKAGYLVRQWVASSLYDRISTRPFLSHIEKKWISFQILTALRDARNRKVSHGDIKSENVLVTSWNWVYVSDFAVHKPTFLPLDDPSDFSYFFDTAGRRTCYLAPERFYTASANPDISTKKARAAAAEDAGTAGRRDGKVTEAMDVFGAGCVLAELFLEGAPLFTLAQLFKYREGDLSVEAHLAAIEDSGVRDLIQQMITLDPVARPSFDLLLHNSRGTVFPECFYSFLHNYLSTLNDLPNPSPFAAVAAAPAGPPSITSPLTPSGASPKGPSTLANLAPVADSSGGKLPNDSDRRIEQLWRDYESIEPYLVPEVQDEVQREDNVRIDYTTLTSVGKAFQDIFPVELHIPNHDSKLAPSSGSGAFAAGEDGPALILLSLVCANIRICQLPSSKVRALDVFLALAVHLTDEAKLDRMVPYIVDLLHDEAPIVRASALRTLVQVLLLATVITPFNASIFPEYIIPNIAHLIRDPEESVRCLYAQCMVPLSETTLRYLEMSQALRAHGAFQRSSDAREYDETHFEISYDASMTDLQSYIQDHLAALLMDPSSVVKRAVLHNISSLCVILGRSATNDVLLSHMITYLNDRDWVLRLAFFESIVDVAACAGGRSLEEYILPLMIQALSDVEETVVAKVLGSLTSLCELGLFQKMRIWELMSATLAFLYHPNIWIRQGAIAFMASAATHLPQSDVWCILYPSLRHYLKSDVHAVNEANLLMALKPMLPRQILDAGVQWAMRADNTMFWKNQRRTPAKLASPRESLMASRKTGVPTPRTRTDEDDLNLAKLRQLGMTSVEEAKLVIMREYISKLAGAISSFPSRMNTETDSGALKTINDVELQRLKVVPQTVFLKSRNNPELRTSRGSGGLQRGLSEATVQRPLLGSPRSSRPGSIDHGVGMGAPFEDLRRRLATINGSTSSLPAAKGRERPTSITSTPPTAIRSPPARDLPDVLAPVERPGSPAESVVSTANSSAFRAMRGLHVGAEAPKAAPAIGSSRTNATGLLEAASRMRSDGSPERSGRTSPQSATGTIRGQSRLRVPSLTPISTYDGQEPGISHLLEHLYLDTHADLQNDFGPTIHDGPIRRRNAGRPSVALRDGASHKPDATLISHLNSHSDAVTGLAVSPDHLFFVSCSDDTTVKVWDTARLERNVTAKPRHTYGQHHSRVKCVCMLEGLHCFASAAEDGSLHVVRVHVSTNHPLPKYAKLHVVREHRLGHQGEYITCMTHWNTDGASNLIYGTTHSNLSVLDLRTMRILQTLENPRHHGPITCLCLDRKRSWVITGTVTGVMTLWDLRFGLLLKSWRAGVHSAAGRKSPRVHYCVVHPTKGKGRWVIIALESQDEASSSTSVMLEVWDVEKTVLVETYATQPSDSPDKPLDQPVKPPTAEAETSPAEAIATLVRARQQSADIFVRRAQGGVQDAVTRPSANVRALFIGLDFGGASGLQRADVVDLSTDFAPRSRSHRGFMIAGSEDRKIRMFDLAKPERSVVLSGAQPETEKVAYSSIADETGTFTSHVETWSIAGSSQSNRAAQRMSLINHNQQDLLKHHQDTITALACIDSPFRGGIVSGDRAGVIKVWKVE